MNSFEKNILPARQPSLSPGTGRAELEFQRLTILTFLQSSVVQSLALSHRDIQPVTQFEGLQVTIPLSPRIMKMYAWE